MNSIKYYILFENHTDGMKFSKALSNRKIKYVISPTPRRLSTCCGISIMYNKNDEEKIKKVIKEEKLQFKGFENLESTMKNYYR